MEKISEKRLVDLSEREMRMYLENTRRDLKIQGDMKIKRVYLSRKPDSFILRCEFENYSSLDLAKGSSLEECKEKWFENMREYYDIESIEELVLLMESSGF